MADLWVVVEYNQASCRIEEIYGPYADEGEAGEAAADRAFNTYSIGRGERFQIGMVVLNDEVYDPDHYADAAQQFDGVSVAECRHPRTEYDERDGTLYCLSCQSWVLPEDGDHAAPGGANPLVWSGDKAESQGPSSLGEGTRQTALIDGDRV